MHLHPQRMRESRLQENQCPDHKEDSIFCLLLVGYIVHCCHMRNIIDALLENGSIANFHLM